MSSSANAKQRAKKGTPLDHPSRGVTNVLPTLEESSSDGSDTPVLANQIVRKKQTAMPVTREPNDPNVVVAPDADVTGGAAVDTAMATSSNVLPSSSSGPANGSGSYNIATSTVEVENLKTRAARLASRGKEEEAISFYYRALRLMRVDLNALTKRLMLNPDDQRFGDKWIQIAASMSEVRTAIAILYERLGAYVKAIAACKEAREIYECSPLYSEENPIPEIEAGLEQIAHMQASLDSAKTSFSDRKNLHEEAIQLRKQVHVTRDPAVRDDLFRKVHVIMNGVLEMEKSSLGETHPQVAETIQIIAQVHEEQRELSDAIKRMSKALSILKLCLGPYHPRCAIAFRELAKLYEQRKSTTDIDMAIGLYAQSTLSFRECYGNKDNMVGASLNNEAVLHILQSDYDLAVEKLSDALVAYGSSMNSDKTINTASAQVWKNLGECYSRRGEFESAHFAYNNALEIQKDARIQAERLGAKVSPGCTDTSLADTLIRLGHATKETLRLENAHRVYKEALLIYRVHYNNAQREASGKISDEVSDAQDRLAHTLYCIAEVQEKRGIYEDAESLYSESLQLRLTSDAFREQNRMNMVHCAMALAGIGSCHMKTSEFSDATMVYKEAVRYLEAHGVPEDHALMKKVHLRLEQAEKGILSSSSFSSEDSDEQPGLPQSNSNMSVEDRTLEMDAESKRLMEEEKYDEAVEVLLRALGIRRRRLAKRQLEESLPKQLPEREDVAMTLVNYAMILFQKEEFRQAESLIKEALRMYQANGFDDDHQTVKVLRSHLTKLSGMIQI